MRFKMGSKVEVMSVNMMLISWRCAEIISGDGHTCLVKLESTNFFERVSWRVIRPCPPPSIEDAELRFVAGETVEVFDYYVSWLSATILNVLNKDCYLVMLLGSSKELRIPKSRIRVRLSWEHEKWVGVGQVSRPNKHLKPNGVRNILKFKRKHLNNDLLQKKVDVGVAYPKEGMGEKGKHYSSLNAYDDNDETCSVGSCSVTIDSKKNGLINDNRKIIGVIRSLERRAYRRTLEVIYASGSLSWEKEAMLTDLRMTLHISNDEHLVELKNLTSSVRDSESIA